MNAAKSTINIRDGTWGGHLIEHCDVFDTVSDDTFPNNRPINKLVEHTTFHELDAQSPSIR